MMQMVTDLKEVMSANKLIFWILDSECGEKSEQKMEKISTN